MNEDSGIIEMNWKSFRGITPLIAGAGAGV